MNRCIARLPLSLAVLACTVIPSSAADPTPTKTPAEPAAAAAPSTYTVKKGPLKITVDLDGVFEGQTAREIFVKPEEWSTLTVLEAVAHGTLVKQGDVVLKLETEKLDRAIDDLQAELKLGDIALQQAADQLQALEKTTPLDVEAAQRAARVAEEDRRRFFDTERPFVLKATEFRLKMTKEMLEYEQEELRQLEKMYKADDITEETEKIVLKRAKDAVDRAKFNVEAAQIGYDEALKFSIPRMDVQVKDSTQRKAIDWEKGKVELPLALQKQRLELEKLKIQRVRNDEKLKKLLADRELMTVKSPIDGMVYYGKATRGKFGDSNLAAEMLRRNGSILANQVVMTVVQPKPLLVRATVPEDQLQHLRPGLSGTATPAGYPDMHLPAMLERVSDVPVAPGTFDARLTVADDGKSASLAPGMACKVKLVPYVKADVLSVPSKAVINDDLDEQKQYVYVLEKDGKAVKCPVTVGKKTDKQVEILSGLAEGAQVLFEAPKDQK